MMEWKGSGQAIEPGLSAWGRLIISCMIRSESSDRDESIDYSQSRTSLSIRGVIWGSTT